MRRLVGRGAVALALAGTAVAVVPGEALALETQNYVYDCGGSRGATLHVTVYGSEPGRWEVVGTDQSGALQPGRAYDIPVPAGKGTVLVGVDGFDPGVIDKQSGVTCNAAP